MHYAAIMRPCRPNNTSVNSKTAAEDIQMNRPAAVRATPRNHFLTEPQQQVSSYSLRSSTPLNSAIDGIAVASGGSHHRQDMPCRCNQCLFRSAFAPPPHIPFGADPRSHQLAFHSSNESSPTNSSVLSDAENRSFVPHRSQSAFINPTKPQGQGAVFTPYQQPHQHPQIPAPPMVPAGSPPSTVWATVQNSPIAMGQAGSEVSIHGEFTAGGSRVQGIIGKKRTKRKKDRRIWGNTEEGTSIRLNGVHVPVIRPGKKRNRCALCTGSFLTEDGKRQRFGKRSKTECGTCGVTLCVDESADTDCFRKWHTQKQL